MPRRRLKPLEFWSLPGTVQLGIIEECIKCSNSDYKWLFNLRCVCKFFEGQIMRLISVKDWVEPNCLKKASVSLLERYLIIRIRCCPQNDFVAQEILCVAGLVQARVDEHSTVPKLCHLVALQLAHRKALSSVLHRLQTSPDVLKCSSDIPLPVAAYFRLNTLVLDALKSHNFQEEVDHELLGNTMNGIASSGSTDLLLILLGKPIDILKQYSAALRDNFIAYDEGKHNTQARVNTPLVQAVFSGHVEMVEHLTSSTYLTPSWEKNCTIINHAALMTIAAHKHEAWNILWKSPHWKTVEKLDLKGEHIWWIELIRFAARYSNYRAMRKILTFVQKKVQLASLTQFGSDFHQVAQEALKVAARKGDVKTIRVLRTFGFCLLERPLDDKIPCGGYATTLQAFQQLEDAVRQGREYLTVVALHECPCILEYHAQEGNLIIIGHILRHYKLMRGDADIILRSAIRAGHFHVLSHLMEVRGKIEGDSFNLSFGLTEATATKDEDMIQLLVEAIREDEIEAEKSEQRT